MRILCLIFGIQFCLVCNLTTAQNVFRYEYDLDASGSGYDSGEGGAGYKSSDGSFYVSGRTFLSGTDDDAYLIKTNSAGAKVFVMQYVLGAPTSYEYISYGRLTADGGYLLYGTTDFNTAGDILLIKTNAAGAVSWSREIDGGVGVNFSTTRFHELSGGGYLLTGSVSGAGAGSSDAFVMSVAANGNSINFARAYGNSRAQSSHSIIEHSSGNISFVGYTFMSGVAPGSNRNAWWVEMNSAGTTINYSKTIGNTTNIEEFHDVIETTGNNYLAVAAWCSDVTACSGGLVEISSSTGNSLLRRVFETNPVGKVFSPTCIYRTPDNNNYWIGGQITDGVSGTSVNDCFMIKTSTASPSPSTGYAIGDSDFNTFVLSSGAVPGNDEFVMGGTEDMTVEWRPTIVKAQSALQCNSATIALSTSNWTLTDLVNLTTTNTGLVGLSLYNLDSGPDLVAVDVTTTTTATQSCFTALPVSLLSFSGKPENNSVKLSWSTASEENNDHFTLERSADGKEFTEIGKVNGAVNSGTVRHYEFTDETPLEQNYYRLSQTDLNGKHEKLGIVSVKLSNEGAGLSLAVQSNPVLNSDLTLDLFSPEGQQVVLRITDVQGRALRQETYAMSEGENRLVSLDISGISKGIYFISATSRKSSVTRKFLHPGKR